MTVVIARSRGLSLARKVVNDSMFSELVQQLSREELAELRNKKLENAVSMFCFPIEGVFRGKDRLLFDNVVMEARPHQMHAGEYFLCPQPLQQPVEDMSYELALKCLLALPSLARELTPEESKLLPFSERVRGVKKPLVDLVDQLVVRTNQEQDVLHSSRVGIEYVVPQELYDVVRCVDVLEARFGIELPEGVGQDSKFLYIMKMSKMYDDEDELLDEIRNADNKLVKLVYDGQIVIGMQQNFYSRGATMVCRVKRSVETVGGSKRKFLLDFIKTAQELYEGENCYRFHDVTLRVRV